MGSRKDTNQPDEAQRATATQLAAVAEPAAVPPWEEISTGRYMPRRIKGSCKGRALG